MNSESASVNIVFLSYRSTLLARQIFSSCCDVSCRFPGVEFSFGYGGENSEDLDYYQATIHNSTSRGARIRFLHTSDLLQRLDYCLQSSKRWTIFVADDDELSEDYLLSFILTSLEVGEDVSLITPSKYRWMLSNGQNDDYVPQPIIHKTAELRYHALINCPLSGSAYYAMHRTVNVSKWLAFMRSKEFFPSYCDHMLVTLDIMAGKSVATLSDSYLVKDISEWKTVKTRTAADGKFYPRPSYVLFHELFWCADMVKMISEINDSNELLVHVGKWVGGQLWHLNANYAQKLDYLHFKDQPQFKGFRYRIGRLGLILRLSNSLGPFMSKANSFFLNKVKEIANEVDLYLGSIK